MQTKARECARRVASSLDPRRRTRRPWDPRRVSSLTHRRGSISTAAAGRRTRRRPRLVVVAASGAPSSGGGVHLGGQAPAREDLDQPLGCLLREVLEVVQGHVEVHLVLPAHHLHHDFLSDAELVQRAVQVGGVFDEVPVQLDDDVAQDEAPGLVPARGLDPRAPRGAAVPGVQHEDVAQAELLDRRSGAKVMPMIGRVTRPYLMICSTMPATMSLGRAKPTPEDDPDVLYIAVLIPISRLPESNRGPPLFPG